MNTPLGFPFGFYVADNTPIDGKYGIIDGGVWRPYVDVAEANAEVPIGIRHIGLTVNIANAEYWWEAGVTDLDLVAKGGGGGAFWPLGGSANLSATTQINIGEFVFQLHNSGAADPSLSGINFYLPDGLGGFSNFEQHIHSFNIFVGDGVDSSAFNVTPTAMQIVINSDAGGMGDVLSSDGAGNVIWAPGGGGASYTFSNGLTELLGDVKLGGPVDEGSFNLLSFDGAMFQFGQDNIPSVGSLVANKIYTQLNISVDKDIDFTGAFGNEFSSYMRGKNATHVYDNEFSMFMYDVNDFSIGYLNATRKRLLSNTSIRDESTFNMIPTQLRFQNTSNVGQVSSLQLNDVDGVRLEGNDGTLSSRAILKPDILQLIVEDPGTQISQVDMQFAQLLITNTDGLDTGTQAFSATSVSFQFPGSTGANFSTNNLGITLADGGNGVALEAGATSLIAQFRVYDGVDTSGIQFDITEFNINSPEIHLNAADGVLDFIGLTVAAIGADAPTDTVIISLGGIPYKFFVKPV